MRKLIVFALAAFAGLGCVSVASAQAHQVQGQIPFDFTAGSVRLSAGEYRITYDLSGLVKFRNLDTGNSVLMFAGSDQSVNDGKCKLVFTRNEDGYFLTQSACSRAKVDFFIPLSRREKQSLERAASPHDGEQTIVAMN